MEIRKMTEEKAIKGLKETLCSLCDCVSQNMDNCDIKECDNRDYIKALEQQTSDDCVSRAELEKWLDLNFSFGGACRKLELFDRLEKELPRVTPKLPTSDDCVSRQAVLDCLTATGLKKFDFIIDAREKVNNLPPVTPTLPEGATNGDMVKAMFPNQTISCAIPITDMNGAKFYRTTINGVTDFTADWWNAPYKVG